MTEENKKSIPRKAFPSWLKVGDVLEVEKITYSDYEVGSGEDIWTYIKFKGVKKTWDLVTG